MGGQRSKVFMTVGGTTVLERSVRLLLDSGAVDSVIVPMRSSDIEEGGAILSGFAGKVEIVEGGRTRALSVSAALAHSTGRGFTHALVHDAARCLASPGLVRRCVQGAFERGAVTAAIPCVDSLKRVTEGGKVHGSLDRSGVWLVQTPQVFRFELLERAHGEGASEATDDASLVERHHPVWVVEGERSNIKITMPGDVELAEKLLG